MPYLIFICIFFTLSISSGYTQEWTATQGDMIEVQSTSKHPITQLKSMGKSWPFKQAKDGTIHAWIGIDLKQKPGIYNIQWIGKTTHIDQLHIQQGKFRISRITVKKNMSHFDAAAIKRIIADQQTIQHTYAINVDIFPLFNQASIPVEGIESTPFGAQRYVNGQPKSPHSGIDIAAPQGTAIKAPLAGKVLLVEDMFLNGTLIAIGHGQGLVSLYAHLSKTYVSLGDHVQAGQIIAKVGTTGRSTGAHLHWGVRFNHARIDPHSLLKLAQQSHHNE